jgi:hypothetical protein
MADPNSLPIFIPGLNPGIFKRRGSVIETRPPQQYERIVLSNPYAGQQANEMQIGQITNPYFNIGAHGSYLPQGLLNNSSTPYSQGQ